MTLCASDFPPVPEITLLKTSMLDRDTFASAALSGIMAKMASTTMPAGTRESLAKLAYQMADAMMAERNKSKEAQ